MEIIVPFTQHKNEIDFLKMFLGPLDLKNGEGYQISSMVEKSHDMFFLISHDQAVGYIQTKFENQIFTINEFEIFKEFRGRGLGKSFAKLVIKELIPWEAHKFHIDLHEREDLEEFWSEAFLAQKC